MKKDKQSILCLPFIGRNSHFLTTEMYLRRTVCMKPCPGFPMKCSFPLRGSSGASLNSTQIHFSVLLPIRLLLICHGFVHVMRLWPTHILNLFSFEVNHAPLTVISSSFFLLKSRVCSQSSGPGSIYQSYGCFFPFN